MRSLSCQIEARTDDAAGTRRLFGQRLFDNYRLEAVIVVVTHHDILAGVDGQIDLMQHPLAPYRMQDGSNSNSRL